MSEDGDCWFETGHGGFEEVVGHGRERFSLATTALGAVEVEAHEKGNEDKGAPKGGGD